MSDDNSKQLDGIETKSNTKTAKETEGGDNTSPQYYIDAIQRLIDLLQSDEHAANIKKSALKLSHYRTIPKCIEQVYNVLNQGCEIIYSTSTKYTLVGKSTAGNEQYQ